LVGTSLFSIIDDKWHQYVFTWRNGDQKFYIDAHEVVAGTEPACTADACVFAIGWFGDGNREVWHGAFAQFLIFDRTLTNREVSALYRLRGSAVR
jgi:hypothetical protein